MRCTCQYFEMIKFIPGIHNRKCLMSKEIKCPKFGCIGTLEKFGSRKKYNKEQKYNETISLYGCDECKTTLEEDEVKQLIKEGN